MTKYIGKSKWLCTCNCGNLTEVRGDKLRNGDIKSCGCLRKDIFTTHGKTDTRLYNIYCEMKRRCYLRSDKSYGKYGGRGIAVCDEWLEDRTTFFDWAINNGYRDDLTIDRIDNNKGYSPDNCKWLTPKQQTRNRRNTIKLTYKSETKSLAEWCEILNLNYKTVYKRIYKLHWSVEKAFEC